VRGAEVLIDGRSAGYTDASGQLRHCCGGATGFARGALERLEDGERSAGRVCGLRAEQRGQVTIVMLEER
jgi:hypothetical protein